MHFQEALTMPRSELAAVALCLQTTSSHAPGPDPGEGGGFPGSPHEVESQILTLHFSTTCSPSISLFLSLPPPTWVALPTPSFVYCVFPFCSKRLGHGKVFPFGECPASDPGELALLGVALAFCLLEPPGKCS